MNLRILLQSNSPSTSSGYGMSTRDLSLIFKDLGCEVGIFAFFGLEGSPSEWNGFKVYPRFHDQYGNDIIDHHARDFGADVVITNVDVHVLKNYGNKMFAWYPIVPVADDPLLAGNYEALRGAAGMCVISRYGQEVLAKAGIPAKYIPLPIPTHIYHPINKSGMRQAWANQELSFPEDTYVIGNVGMNRGNRKGHDILLHAFRLFLSEVPHAFLYIHTDPLQYDGIDLMTLRSQLGLENFVRFPDRYSVNMGYSVDWMQGMYNILDLYVQPSRNEGQALPVFEAMSTGLPIVATNATSLSEIMGEGVDTIPVHAQKEWKNTNSWGYSANPEDFAQAMYEAYRKWGRGYISLANRQQAIETVSPLTVRELWRQELAQLEKRLRYTPIEITWKGKDKPHIVHLSTTEENCGIGAYTRNLMNAMSDNTIQKVVDILGPIDVGQLNGTDLVNVHYEAAIAPRNLDQICVMLKQLGIKVVVTYHGIDITSIARMLKKNLIDKALIHWPMPGMQINDERVTVLGGLGVPVFIQPDIKFKYEFKERYGFEKNDVIISTFGFASLGRGHYELLEFFAPSLRANRRVKLQLLLSQNFLNEAGEKLVYNQIRKVIKDFDVQQQVVLVTDFIPDLEVIQRLWVSDVGYLYMGMNTTSSSAAIRHFIAARLPTVVTPSTHFLDIPRGIVRTSSFSLPGFAQRVWEVMMDEKLRFQLRKQHDDTYFYWQWPRFADKYLHTYKQLLGMS